MIVRRDDRLLVPALIVVLAVTVSAWPLGSLFIATPWRGPLLGTLLVVAFTGALTRPYSRSMAPIAQAVAFVAALTWLFGEGTRLFGVVPTPDTVGVAQALVADAIDTIRTSPAPAPGTQGVAFAFTAGFGAVGLVADAIAVTLRRPLGAVVPLLIPFLAAVANLGTPMPWYHVAALVGAICLLLADGHRRTVGSWAGVRSPGDGATHRPGAATALWATAVLLAVLAASALPHLPTRYLADGLGRSTGLQGQVGFTPYPDLTMDLRSDDTTPVLSYHTDDPLPPPIKIATSSRVEPTGWVQGSRAGVSPSDAPSFPPPPGLSPDIDTVTHTFSVVSTRLEPPYLASPTPVIQGSVAGARWNLDPTSQMLITDRRPSSYSMTYVTPVEQAGGTTPVRATRLLEEGLITPDDLDTSSSTPLLRSLLEDVTTGADTPAQRADAIQHWLREDPSFSYSLDLPAPAGQDGIDAFLRNRTGYCTHFATTMILMAREEGIPARLATGFLAGTAEGDERVVRANDAHAWPELYLDRLGWVRYEPTPSTRTGIAPVYAPQTQTTTDPDPETASPTPTATETGGTTAAPARPDRAEGAPDAEERSTGRPAPTYLAPALGILLLVLLALAASPSVSWLRHRRRLAGAVSPAAEIEEVWRWTNTRLADLDVTAPPAATIRSRGALYRATLTDAGHLPARRGRGGMDEDDPAEAVDRLVAVAEEARYARSPRLEPERLTAAREDAATVIRAARDRADRRTRLRALLLPSDGITRHVMTEDSPI